MQIKLTNTQIEKELDDQYIVFLRNFRHVTKSNKNAVDIYIRHMKVRLLEIEKEQMDNPDI